MFDLYLIVTVIIKNGKLLRQYIKLSEKLFFKTHLFKTHFQNFENILKILTIYTRKGYCSHQANGPNEVAMVHVVIWEISMAERGVCTIPCCVVQFHNFPAHCRVILYSVA